MKGIEAFLRAATGAPQRRGIDAFLEGPESALGVSSQMLAGIGSQIGLSQSAALAGFDTDGQAFEGGAPGASSQTTAEQIVSELAQQHPRAQTSVSRFAEIDGEPAILLGGNFHQILQGLARMEFTTIKFTVHTTTFDPDLMAGEISKNTYKYDLDLDNNSDDMEKVEFEHLVTNNPQDQNI